MPSNYPSARPAEYRRPRSLTWTTSWSAPRGHDERRPLRQTCHGEVCGRPVPPLEQVAELRTLTAENAETAEKIRISAFSARSAVNSETRFKLRAVNKASTHAAAPATRVQR